MFFVEWAVSFARASVEWAVSFAGESVEWAVSFARASVEWAVSFTRASVEWAVSFARASVQMCKESPRLFNGKSEMNEMVVMYMWVDFCVWRLKCLWLRIWNSSYDTVHLGL